MQVGLVKKVLKQGGLTTNIPSNVQHGVLPQKQWKQA